MPKHLLTIILMLFVFNTHAASWSGNVNFFLGQKSLDENEWAPVDEQGEFGVMVDFGERSWPVNIALDFLVSYDEVTEFGIIFEGLTTEFNGGIRKVWEVGSYFRPYIGGGLALVSAEFQATDFVSVTDDDNAMGIWLNGGVYWTLGRSFNIGLDLRYSTADVTLFGVDADAGGTHAGLLLGWHW